MFRKTTVPVLLSVALAFHLPSFSETVLGTFQSEGSVRSMGRSSTGLGRMSLEAAKLVDIRGRKPEDLAVQMEIRVTRHDGIVGNDSLKHVRGGHVAITDSTGAEVFRAGSPVQDGVLSAERQAGRWMSVTVPLAKLKDNSGFLNVLSVADYNDIPKHAEDTGITYEVRNARVTARDKDETGLVRMDKAVESANPRTVCNPIDLEYMIQRRKKRPDGTLENTMTESADPALVVFRGEYWLFASHGDGYWFSKDMGKWTFVPVDISKPVLSEFKRYAPATCVIGDWLYLTHSESGRIIRTKDPHNIDGWEDVGRPSGWMDPGMLYDDPATGGDGYVYLYKGLSHFEPIDAIKLDPKNGMNKVVPDNFQCAWPDRENRGFEVPGDNSIDYGGKDTQEGAWPVKYKGRYYITCAVPGTQYAGYCDNCYVGESPIGPFRFCFNSPVAWKCTGYTRGAGHGCLFEDLNGHWWKVDTCRLVGFDRRLVLLPAMFDDKGDLYTNAERSDFPFFVPGKSRDPFNAPGPGWMLLSYGKRAVASSNSEGASLAFDEDMGTCWTAATGKPGEWLQVDLGKLYAVWSVQVNFTTGNPQAGGRDNDWAYRYLMEFSQDGKTWRTLVDRTSQKVLRQHEYIEFENKVGVRYVRIVNKGESPAGSRFALNGLRIFGEGGGRAPAAVDMDKVVADRRAKNNRSAGVSWPKAEGAQGYVVRYGIAPDRLHTHYQVFGEESVVVNTLCRGVDYYMTVDSFNESGVTPGTKTVFLPATEPLVEGYDMRGDSPSPAITNRVAGVAVHEAEKARLSGKGVRPEYEVRASGAKALHGFGARGTKVEFAGVSAAASGKGVLRISYATPFAAKALVSVNGGKPQEVAFPKTRGWPTFVTIDVPISDVRKSNTIVMEGTGDRVHLDYVQLLP